MKQIYIIAILLLPHIGFSQLVIKPSSNHNSYIYVVDRMLFVEKEINLIANSGSNAAPNIFLRDQSQLLQGNSNSINAGDGKISVFQEGVATNFTYNYWSAPVIDPNPNSSFGSILFDPLEKTQSIAAIITSEHNGTSNPLKISNKWIYKLSGTEYSDWEYVGDRFKVKPGEGFTMKGVSGTNLNVIIYGIVNNPGDNQRYDFRGRPNSGNYSLDIKEGDSKLIGNPYPSALDLNYFLFENTNTTGIAYFWDSKSTGSHFLKEYEGGYGAYSPGAGIYGYVPAVFNKYDGYGNTISNSGVTGNYYARRYSPIAQGFIVIGSKDGVINFKNEYRSYIKEDLILSQFKSKGKKKKASVNEDYPLLRLNIGFHDKYVRQILLVLQDAATVGIDHARDAINPEYLSSDAGWYMEEDNYLINVRPFDELEEIPLYILLTEASEVTFEIAEIKNINADVFLFDKVTGIYYNLKNTSPKLGLEAGEYLERFKLTYTNKEFLFVNWEIVKDINNYNIFQNNPDAVLEVRIPVRNTPVNITLYDALGKKIAEKKNITNEQLHEFPTRRLSKGLYIIKITNLNAAVISKKVIISN
tara:strand:- start:29959 stop:31713 length:1755 start_codon:yes stop_codon:yes gene_type:complete